MHRRALCVAVIALCHCLLVVDATPTGPGHTLAFGSPFTSPLPGAGSSPWSSPGSQWYTPPQQAMHRHSPSATSSREHGMMRVPSALAAGAGDEWSPDAASSFHEITSMKSSTDSRRGPASEASITRASSFVESARNYDDWPSRAVVWLKSMEQAHQNSHNEVYFIALLEKIIHARDEALHTDHTDRGAGQTMVDLWSTDLLLAMEWASRQLVDSDNVNSEVGIYGFTELLDAFISFAGEPESVFYCKLTRIVMTAYKQMAMSGNRATIARLIQASPTVAAMHFQLDIVMGLLCYFEQTSVMRGGPTASTQPIIALKLAALDALYKSLDQNDIYLEQLKNRATGQLELVWRVKFQPPDRSRGHMMLMFPANVDIECPAMRWRFRAQVSPYVKALAAQAILARRRRAEKS